MPPLVPRIATVLIAAVVSFTTVLSAPTSADEGDPLSETIAWALQRVNEGCVYAELFWWDPGNEYTVTACIPRA